MVAARNAGSKRTRAQSDFLAEHGQRTSAAGEARAATARRYNSPETKRALAELAAAYNRKRQGSGHAGGILGTIDNALSGKLAAGAVDLANEGVDRAAPAITAIVRGPIGLAGDALVKKTTGLDIDKFVTREIRAAGKDIVDTPANAVPSVYLPTKEAVSGHPGKAARMLADPFIQVAKHPGKSLEEHPVNTILLARGIEGAVGHGVGKALRSAPSETLRKAGSLERGSAEIANANTKVHEERTYSKDAIVAAGQKLRDRRRAAKGKEPVGGHVTEADIKRRANERVAANEDVRRANRGEVVGEARTILDQRGPVAKLKGRRPTAATSAFAQGIATTPEELAAYLGHLKEAARGLEGDKLRRNKQTQVELERALKNPKKLAHSAEQASKYKDMNIALQQMLEKTKIIDPEVMQARRRLPAEASPVRTPAEGEEGAYVTHAPSRRGARNFYVSTNKPPSYHGPAATGAAVREGTLDLHPETLVESAAHARGLIDAVHRFRASVDEFGHRAPNGKLKMFTNFQQAADAAREMRVARDGSPVPHGVEMVPIRINPLGGRHSQMRALLEGMDHPSASDGIHGLMAHALESDPVKADTTSAGPWVLAPKAFADTQREHLQVGSSTMGKVGQLYGGQFRKVVLAVSPKWLTGNVVEAALRSMVGHAGPRSLYTGHKVQREYEKLYGKEASAELRSRTTGGGHYSLSQRTDVRRTADDLAEAGTRLAKFSESMGKLRRTTGPKQVADAWDAYTHVVMNSLNGRIEHQFQTAMFGKALRDHPLMADRTLKLSQQALQDAARGLKNTNAQVRLGREVDRMYGRYSKFSPELRRLIAGYTPFIAWSLSTVKFLFHVLPVDHPVLTSVIASANQATEEWRRQHGLIESFVENMAGSKPVFLQGSIPGKGDSSLRVSHYTPFGIYDQEGGLLGAFVGALLPQAQGVVMNAQGKDWRDKSLTGTDRTKSPTQARDLLAAGVTVLENSIPFASQAADTAGIHLPNEADGTKHPGTVLQRLRKRNDPFMYSQSGTPSATVNLQDILDGKAKLPDVPEVPPLPPLPPLPRLPKSITMHVR